MNVFLDSTPNDLQPYFDAEKMKQERIDYNQWMMGMYVLDAVHVAVSKCLVGNKSRAEYFDAPISQQKEKKALTDAEKFEMWVSAFNSQKDTDT